MGFAGLVIDLGHLFYVRSTLQNAGDAASLAAAATLPVGSNEARQQGRILAKKYIILGSTVNLADVDIELGTWDKGTKTFTVLAEAQEAEANSVRVVTQRTEARNDPVPLWFMPVFGNKTSNVDAVAVALFRPFICGAIIGEIRVTLNSSGTTDSYISDHGPYNPFTARKNGDVCSCGDIYMNSNAVVNGDATPGPGKSVIFASQAYVTGSTEPGGCPVLPDVELGDVATVNDNGTIWLTVSGEDPFPNGPYDLELVNADELVLDGGTYYFTSLSLNSGSTLRITGETVIYVTGSFAVNSSTITNDTLIPENLIFMISSSDEVKLDSSADFSGVIYAPNAHVVVDSSANWDGAIMADEVTLNSTIGIHYDETLDDMTFLDRMRIDTAWANSILVQ